MIIHYIYYIYHVSKKYYVGKTKDYINRFQQHMKYGNRGYITEDNLYTKRGLYLAMRKSKYVKLSTEACKKILAKKK